ncbi:hypothetical protein HEB94_000246 [Actinopolymorpha pittospori]|uniref:Bacterial transcriptional activator domain-containing protein n=1 Tax=Actinopolymorpha pittospori TaxID=648752 RepID=A0A927MQJ6_9ACTN|nr:hypothetical protein [Actinopolymorpha pittospori]
MRADDCLVELGGARLRALTIRLALDAGRPVPPQALVRALWPERSPANPSAALYSAVSRLRQALPDGTALRFEGGAYLLEVRPDDVDVHRFERLASQGRRALRAGEAGLAGRRLREALALWRGPALAEVSEVPYAAAVVVRLEELRLAAVEDRVEADSTARRPASPSTSTPARPQRARSAPKGPRSRSTTRAVRSTGSGATPTSHMIRRRRRRCWTRSASSTRTATGTESCSAAGSSSCGSTTRPTPAPSTSRRTTYSGATGRPSGSRSRSTRSHRPPTPISGGEAN